MPDVDAPQSAVDWDAIWQAVTEDLVEDPFVPKFLTEEGVRLATLRALSSQVDVVACATTEYPALDLGGDPGGRLDLVVQQGSGTMVVGFKFLREPKQKLPPWPDHLGGVLAETHRLGVLRYLAKVERGIQVIVSAAAFLGYAQRTFKRLELADYGSGDLLPRRVLLTPERTQGPSPTTRRALKGRDQKWQVTANRTTGTQIGSKGLWMAAYSVNAIPSGVDQPLSG